MAAIAPALCAAHCAAAPIIAAAAPALGGNPVIEWSAIGLSLFLVTLSMRHTKDALLRPTVLIAAAGFILWLLALTTISTGSLHTPLLVVGSLTVALSVLVDVRNSRHVCHH